MLFLQDPIWFPPVSVIYHFKRLVKDGKLNPSMPIYKKAKEAFITGISLVGITKIKNKDFWMQIVGDEEGSPDTRTGCYEKVTRDNDFSYQDVEVVTFDSNSNLSLIDFLLNTKLSKNKAYDDKTTILCFVDKEIIIPPHQILNQTLINKKLKSQSPIILVGKVYPNKNIYSLAQIYPTIDLVLNEFDVIEECKNRPLKILKLNRFAKGAIDFKPNSEEKHYPFEKLGIK